MEALPKVTVLSVFHNREDTAIESVRSLMNQSYPNLEIIIVDDFSKDNTLKVIQELAASDIRLKVVANKPNKGFVASLIDVIKDLDSKYVAIHGAGDISLPARIETQVKFLEANSDVGVVSVGVVNRSYDNVSNKPKQITLKDQLKRNNLNHGATMFRLSDYHKVGGYRSYFVQRQDKDLWYRMSLITKLYFLPDKLYQWVVQTSSVSADTGKNITQSLISEFATFLIKERVVQGYDSIDKHGDRAALIFNPSTSNHIFYRDFRYNFIRMRFSLAYRHLDGLVKINTSWLTLGFLYCLKGITRFFMLFSK